MKSNIVKQEQEKELKYPCLRYNEANDMVVLFIGDGVGTVLTTNGRAFKIGAYSNSWSMHTFTEFTGKVELFND